MASPPAEPGPSAAQGLDMSGGHRRKRARPELTETPPARANYTEVDLEHFSETHDLKIRHFKQCIHEDVSPPGPPTGPWDRRPSFDFAPIFQPSITWQFVNPKHTEDEFKFRITLRSETNHRGGAAGLRVVDIPDGFVVQVANQGQRSIKYNLSVRVMGEDGGVKVLKTERCSARDESQFTMVSFSGRYAKYLTPQGTLFLQVRLDIHTGIAYRSSRQKIRMDEARTRLYKTLPEDIKNMQDESNFNDVSIKCGDVIMRCSKFILCARSDVFRAMFSHEMKESRELQIRIEDVEPSTLKDMLEFLYGDDVKGICLGRTVKLLPLAEKYNIRSLSHFCVEALSTHISVEHAGDIAVLAEQHHIRPLLEKATNFMLMNANRVLKTDGWRAVLQTCPEIANKMIASLSKYREDTCITEDILRRQMTRDREYIIDYPAIFVAPPNNPEEEVLPQFLVQQGNLEMEAADHVVDVDIPGLNMN
eukprot:maker-scaffold289_size220122-snap-gene-1.26 protein:Tk01617 transcript:maker-scaffold289_size220122-snap-gene-1.26-mRNA-1 annotation:"speckle-type poz isoform x2"